MYKSFAPAYVYVEVSSYLVFQSGIVVLHETRHLGIFDVPNISQASCGSRGGATGAPPPPFRVEKKQKTTLFGPKFALERTI